MVAAVILKMSYLYSLTKNIVMRKLLLLATGMVVLGSLSCNKIADQLAQTISWQGVDVTIDVPPSTGTSYSTIGTSVFSYDLDSLVKKTTNNVLSLKNIDKFTFKSCKLTILNPDAGNNFGNFEKAKVEFFTNANITPTLLGEVPSNSSTYAESLDLPINNTSNMMTYIPSSGPIIVSYQVSGQLRAPTTTTLHIQAHVTYDVHITP